ncbi:diguanylate cyclase [Ferviditalea candida]|uniref:Diguanylate cyclase n=1 Tax=Ferviditalea candida TaxID=3108399 RepID=A0ABU5ZMY8_9BACL|nr:diguanylate cyclase [Paenibacillaceae bacterium T2]
MNGNLKEDYVDGQQLSGWDEASDAKQTELFSHALLRDSFLSWASQLKTDSVFKDGILFVCDASGELIDSTAMSSNHGAQVETVSPAFLQGAAWSEANLGRNAVATAMKSRLPSRGGAEGLDAASLKGFVTYAVPCRAFGQVSCYLGLLQPSGKETGSELALMKASAPAFGLQLELLTEKKKSEHLNEMHEYNQAELTKRDLLIETSKKLHSKIDADSVLAEIFQSFEKIYPSVEIDLFLSQDSHSSNLPVKPLIFQHNDNEDLLTRAYMEGRLILETSSDGTAPLAVPLSGKQGVYGILQMKMNQYPLDQSDINLISALAETAGNAFENARLYEHSNTLINELRIINEITKRLNQSLKLQDIFNFASRKLISTFGADYACIMRVDRENQRMVVQASNVLGVLNESTALDEGFSGLAYSTKDPIIVSDYHEQSNIKSRLMEITSSRSLIASPIIVNNEVVGVILVLHRKANYFSYENYKLLQVLSGHIGLAISNASLHAEVKRMVITDHLTGLYARHYLDEQVNFMQKKDYCGALIVADIDNFKKINDTFGHQIGDQILIQVSNIIKSSIRDTDIAARWGGEELAIYLPQATLEHTLQVAERIRKRIFDDTKPQVTVSCGIADWSWEDERISVESLFYKADMALYEAKHQGKNRIRVAKAN